MNAHFSAPISVGSDKNTHTLEIYVHDNGVSISRVETVFGWNGNQTYDTSVCRMTREALKRLAREILESET